MNYRNYVGYCLDNKGLHVCGYEGNKVIIQDNSNGISNPKKYKLSTNSRGTYFTFQGKRVFVEKV